MRSLIKLKIIFWLIRLAFRFLTGRPLSGNVYTDSSRHFFRKGTRALHPDGIASRWSMLAGYQRAGYRLLTVFGPPTCVVAYVIHPVATTVIACTLTGSTGTYAGWRIYRALAGWKYKRQVVRPLVAALAPALQLPLATIETRMALPTADANHIRIPLPEHWQGTQAAHKDIERLVSQRLGGEWDLATQLKRAPFYLHFTPRPAPPSQVVYGQGPLGQLVAQAILETTEDRPVLGLGARADLIHLDFTGEIAHLAASIGTGGGKSSFLRFLIAQFAHHGVRHFDVCDVKWVSLAGMEEVPGLRIYRHVEEIWEAVAAFRAEMDRRYRILLKNPSKVFPRWVLLMEEQNAFALETDIVWKTAGHKGRHPMWTDLALLLVKARQVNMNLISVYQRMSAEASGGGVSRDQYGLKLLSRFSPQAWDSLVGTRPRATSSAIQGRAVAVMGGLQRQVQIPFISVADAMALATSGPAVTVTDDTNHEVSAVTAVTVTPKLTLAEAARQPWCPISYDTLRQRKARGRLVLPEGDRWTETELRAALSDQLPGGSDATTD